MQTMKEFLEAAGESTNAEITAIDAEIERQEEWKRLVTEWCDYTLERLKYRRSLLAAVKPLVIDEPPGESGEVVPAEPSDEERAAAILGMDKAA